MDRENRRSGSWVVVLNVPEEPQVWIVSKKGTPTRRLQQSTDTDSLALARSDSLGSCRLCTSNWRMHPAYSEKWLMNA